MLITGNVGCSMSVVLVHESGSSPVQPGHGVHTPLVGLADILLGNDQFDPVPTLGLIKPLVGVDAHLGSKRLSEDKHITDNSRVGAEEIGNSRNLHETLAICETQLLAFKNIPQPRASQLRHGTYMINSLGWQTVVATPPIVHHGFMTVWPPVTVEPASRAQSLKPLIISGMTTSRSFSVILVETASNINMLSHSVTPMAYKSERTLAQAILPGKTEGRGVNKSKAAIT